MSKIVIDARELRQSTGRYVERLLHYLQKLDTTNDYTVLLKPDDFNGWQPSANNFHTLVCPHKEFTFGEQIGLKKQIADLGADLVHFAIVQQPIFYRGRVVTTMHDLTTTRFKNPDKNKLIYAIKQKVYKFVIQQAARKSRVIITPSEYVRSDIVNFTHIDPTKVQVVYEAADRIVEPSVPLPYLENKQFIMYIGRPMPHKNLGRLIEAFASLRARHPELLLVLAGKKDANYLSIEAGIHASLKPSIIFTDFVSEGQLRWLYEHCAAYVFPSLSEGFGLPGLEAMTHGAPVVSSNATCLPEIYGNAAHYFDPLDIGSMATAIDNVLTNESLRQQLITAGIQQAGQYSWQRLAEQTLAIYNRALL